MLKPRWRKVFRDLWGNKVRTLLVVLSITVGIFAVGMIESSQEILSQNLSDTYNAINPASARLYTKPFGDDLIKSVSRMKKISAAEGRYRTSMRFRLKSNSGNDEWHNLDLTAISDFDNIRIDKIKSELGAWPPQEDEILLERSLLGIMKIEIGDTLVIEMADGEQRDLRVAGLVHDLQQVPSKFTGTACGYINFDTLESLGEPRKFNQLSIVVSQNKLDKQHINKIAAEVRDDRVEPSGVSVRRISVPEPGKHQMDSAVTAMMLILKSLGALSLFLSGFLVVNTISAIMAQQTRQIGVMKAVGGSTYQITGIYLGIVVVFGLLSVALAIPLEILGTRAFTSFAASLLNFDIENPSAPPWVRILEVAIGLIMPILAAIYPVVAGTRVTVREALSSYGLSKSKVKTSLVDRLLMRMNRLSRPLLLSLRNTFRRKGRLALTLITLILASAIFISVYNVRSSLMNTLEQIMQYWRYDISINFIQPYRIKQIERSALRVPDVEGIESWIFKNVFYLRPDGTENQSIFMLAPPAATNLIQPNILRGRWLLPNDRNAIVVNTDLTKEEPDIDLGDNLIFKVDGRKTKWHVVGIVVGQFAGPTAYANYSHMARITRNAGQTDFIVVKTSEHDPSSQSYTAKLMEERFKLLGLRVRSTETHGEIRSRIKFQFDTIVVFLMIMAFLLAVVGGLGLMGTMSINVLERTREIGVMRATGASNYSLLQIFVVESIIIGVISWFFGTLLAIPLSKLLSDAVGMAFLKVPLNYSFSANGVLIWLAAVIVISAMASLLPALKAARLSVREILSYE